MAAVLPDALRRGLLDLQQKADSDEEAHELLNEALKAANDAGWSYRQLGNALGVSHFYVSDRIRRASGSVQDFGFQIPERPRPARVLQPRELPEEIASDLRTRLEKAVSEHTAKRTANGLEPAVAEYFQALEAALEAGWDPYEIAVPLGLNPRAVSRFTAYHGQAAQEGQLSYPRAPERTGPASWDARYPAAPQVKIPASEAGALRELAAQAHMNRGVAGDEDGGALESARNYTTRIAGWYLRGASRQALEEATGQGWEALRKRLSRWGYMSPPRTG
ncbi:hypothetical protein [Arthrobacter sp. IK3]|uniref:hypothetical protein n=1 Tax=Arthrobacter sp. IK3 TaxID=3448169 RepID=UPI003EE3610F